MKPRISLAGWRGVWPPDARAGETLDAPVDEATALSASAWFATEPLRRLLATEDLPMSRERIVAALGEQAIDRAPALVEAGYLRAIKGRFGLTAEGKRTLEWAGAPKPEGVLERSTFMVGGRTVIGWAAQLSSAIAALYGVTVHEMIATGTIGPSVKARARLCAALHARGWSDRAIETFFHMPRGWARTGIERWNRSRG